jgi:predicted metalloenzyme YecM
MKKFKHSFWRYVPSNDERQSFFKFVETFETQSDVVPDFQDHYCIDHILDLETGQMRVKNHSAPEYCVSKYVGWSLELPPVEKTNKQEIYVVIHRSSFSHKKIEYDEFLEPKQKRYTQEEWEYLLSVIEKRFNRQKDWAKDGIKIPTQYEDGTQVFKTDEEYRAFSLGRRAYFLYQIVNNYRFTHLIRKVNIGYTQ